MASRPQIEHLLATTNGQETSGLKDAATVSNTPRPLTGAEMAAGIVSGLVNRNIQQLALKYNRDCRLAFEELSKVVQVSNYLESITLYCSYYVCTKCITRFLETHR